MCLRRPLQLLAHVGAALLTACAPGRVPGPGELRGEPVPPSAAEATPLPELPVAAPGRAERAEPPQRRIEQLEVVDRDLRSVLRALAESYGLDYQLDPAVSGRVTVRLRDVTLAEALNALVLPHGYTYRIQGRVLRVQPARLETRIFGLDYISVSRAGTGTTVVQRRLGPGAVGLERLEGLRPEVIPGGVASGADLIQSVSIADLWEEIRVALEGLVFSGTPGSGETGVGIGVQPAELPALVLPGATRAPGPYSRVGDDGRRLIVNPLPGTIVVTAPPETLAEVATFLATVQASVRRQVLIEAKIVEVALDPAFRLGIDWGLVERSGSVDLRSDGGAGDAELTLGGPGGDAEREIDQVLRALEGQGEVSVLHSPRVSTLNNQRAVINASTDEVYFLANRQPILGPTGAAIGFDTDIVPQQVAIGVMLDVLPQIAADNTITMSVRPVVTGLVAERSIRFPDGSRATAPVIDRRESDNVVRVRDGETIVIAGLMTTQERAVQRGIPGLRDIPVIGWLFGGTSWRTEKRELVIFITPRIVAGQPPLGI